MASIKSGGTAWRLPLHVVTAGGAIALLLIVSLVLAYHAYSNTRQVLLSSVDESIAHVSNALQNRINGILRPAENQIELLGNHDLVHASTQAERLTALPVVRAALASNSLLDAIYVAYPDGDFMLFRPVRDDLVRRVFRAPLAADLLVQSQTRQTDGRMLGEFLYFDRAGKLLQRIARDDYVFDARTRAWYQQAASHSGTIFADPYVFFTTRSVGTTLARRVSGNVIVGLDVTLAGLAQEIAGLRVTPGSRVAIVDAKGQVLARDQDVEPAFDDAGNIKPQYVADIDLPALGAAAGLARGSIQREHRAIGKADWELVSIPVELRAQGRSLRVLMAVPHNELFRDARKLLRQQLLMTLLLIVALAPAGYFLTQQLTKPLRGLAEDTRSIAAFDFSGADLPRSRIAEVDLLATATMQMKSTIARFLGVSAALSSETRLERLLEVVLHDVAATTHARSGALYLFDADKQMLVRSQLMQGADAHAVHPEVLAPEHDRTHPGAQLMSARTSIIGKTHIDGPELVAVPLETLGRDFVGALVLELSHPLVLMQNGRRNPELAFIEALSSTAAVAIETRHLVDSQKHLLEALIQLLAGAIDSKSPYTGGHCQRVPEITKMLVRAAQDASEGPFRDFHLNEEEWEAIHVGAWLHDCGKITTPEHVVDKATKLESINNRIHEVRTRFEVIKRDAEISYWRARSQGEAEETALAALQAKRAALDDDFAFVAGCNVGGESLDPEKIERLRRIAQRPWMRTLDDRLGLSREEARMLEDIPPHPLPCVESLLADKPEHLVPREAGETVPELNKWGFRVKVPKYKFNRGELYNLSISRGTLTEEERFIINDHIVQTIIMLDRLPFPRHLRSVPEIAGGHHERMDGRGYPKGLKREEMSIPARIMAIADVFEALTAADRPYKAPKTLSESLAIMARMTREQHLDADLFELFLRSGVYRQYAERFLAPSQIDQVDIDALLENGAAFAL